jgi:hypothetical protein
MALRKLAKDPSSGMNGCHTVYVLDTDPTRLVIQADLADDETIAEMENLLQGEGGLVIKREVVEEALRILREEEAGDS